MLTCEWPFGFVRCAIFHFCNPVVTGRIGWYSGIDRGRRQPVLPRQFAISVHQLQRNPHV